MRKRRKPEKINDDNFKAFFKLANRKKKMKKAIGPLRIGNGDNYTNDPKRITAILSKQYASVFSEPRFTANTANLKDCEGEKLLDIKLLEDAFEGAMGEIKMGSSPGPYEIPAVVYKRYAKALAGLLKKI